jgi:hypothetical protein
MKRHRGSVLHETIAALREDNDALAEKAAAWDRLVLLLAGPLTEWPRGTILARDGQLLAWVLRQREAKTR